MNEACSSLTIVTPPFVEVNIGQGLFKQNTFDNVTKIGVTYVSAGEVVIGLSGGMILNKKRPLDNMSVDLFLGYNVAGCIMLGPTFGLTNITTVKISNELEPVIYKGWHPNVGMMGKFIMGRISFGAFGSSSGVGMTLGIVL
jgi:hypothetical protein